MARMFARSHRSASVSILSVAAFLAAAACGPGSTPVVEERAAAEDCTACHGIPPPAPHIASTDCGLCHPGATSTTTSPQYHQNGVVDTVMCGGTCGCVSCHGDPPRSHVPAPAGAGGTGDFRDCGACHPGYTAAYPPGPGHQNGVVEWALGPTSCGVCHGSPPAATATGTHSPSTSCGDCHAGYTATTVGPTHMAGCVDMACQPTCGSCHGNPPASHVPAPPGAGGTGGFAQCGTCHLGYTATTVDATRHQDGIVDLALEATSCGVCHGAPPPAPHTTSMQCGSCHCGYTSTTVDAPTHRTGTVEVYGGCGDPVTCTSCHGNPPAATHVVAPPGSGGTGAFDACGSCHPATSTTTTAVTATHRNAIIEYALGFATCTTCHASPPPATHAVSPPGSGGTGSFTSCASCHVGYTATTINMTAHRDGIEEFTLGTSTCTICHASPPPSTHVVQPRGSLGTGNFATCGTCHLGYTATTVPPATHLDHVEQVTLGAGSCTTCHAAPPTNTHVRASSTSGGTLNFAACATCHPGYTATTVPAVGHRDGIEQFTLGAASCNVCHGSGTSTTAATPPPAPHVQDAACGACHTGYTSTTVPTTHRNGTVCTDGCGVECITCHGIPPATTHVVQPAGSQGTGNFSSCGLCHPATSLSSTGVTATHRNGIEEITLGASSCSTCHAAPPPGTHAVQPAGSGGTGSFGACAMCHTGYTATTVPATGHRDGVEQFTLGTTTCAICHGAPPPAPHPARTDCGSCHPGYGATIVALWIHRNGVVDVAAPVISATPGALDFGSVQAGSSRELAVTLTNAGGADLVVSGVAACPGTTGEFTFAAGGFTIAPGATYALPVTYAPTGAGTDGGCIALSSNDAFRNPYVVNLSGTGTAPPPPVISVSPAALDFGYLARWAGARALAFAVANTGGSALSVRAARCSGTTAEFLVAPTALSVSPGETQWVTVTYDPEDTGADSGCVELASDDPARPVVRVSVTGTSVQPRVPSIRTSPTSLGFGTVTVGYSRSLALTVSNPGTATLYVSGVARCSGTSDEFRVSSSSFSVSPGTSRQLSVSYRPSGWGTDSGCIAISSNDPARPRAEVQVSGTGASGR